jgi:hypothetical protein
MSGFEVYDVLEIDWRKGQGWQEYCCLKNEREGAEAVRIVDGGVCQSMPHWIERGQVQFRIVSRRGEVKRTEADRRAGGRPRNSRKTWTERLGPITPADLVLGREVLRNEGNDQYRVLQRFPDADVAFAAFKAWQAGH